MFRHSRRTAGPTSHALRKTTKLCPAVAAAALCQVFELYRANDTSRGRIMNRITISNLAAVHDLSREEKLRITGGSLWDGQRPWPPRRRCILFGGSFKLGSFRPPKVICFSTPQRPGR